MRFLESKSLSRCCKNVYLTDTKPNGQALLKKVNYYFKLFFLNVQLKRIELIIDN
jgi:hypothetical protein